MKHFESTIICVIVLIPVIMAIVGVAIFCGGHLALLPLSMVFGAVSFAGYAVFTEELREYKRKRNTSERV